MSTLGIGDNLTTFPHTLLMNLTATRLPSHPAAEEVGADDRAKANSGLALDWLYARTPVGM